MGAYTPLQPRQPKPAVVSLLFDLPPLVKREKYRDGTYSRQIRLRGSQISETHQNSVTPCGLVGTRCRHAATWCAFTPHAHRPRA
jgi:hypothetical protein